jgi:peptidoglycan/LPS O-acetylase OafA/YrhL
VPPPVPIPREATRLAYLDGLRGWMALVVVLTHLFASWLLFPPQLKAIGATWLLDLIRWTPLGPMLDGFQAVYIFFFISGLAISFPILRSQTPTRTMWRMAVYRYPRLTLPILGSCLLAFVLLATGAFANREVAKHAVTPWFDSIYTFPANFGAMLKFALWDVYQYVPSESSWNLVLWTMPVELFGSFYLFLLLAIVPWRWLRLVIALGPAGYWAATTNYGYLLGFFVGYALAELLVAAERSETVRQRLAAARPAGLPCLAIALLLSMHQQIVAFQQNRDAYALEIDLIAALTLIGVILSPTVQRWLSNRVSRFLGRISFGLYLTHLLVICSFSSTVYVALIERVPYWAVVCVVGSLTLPLAFGVGYGFTVLVEEQLLRRVKRVTVSVADWSLTVILTLVRGLWARTYLRKRMAEGD